MAKKPAGKKPSVVKEFPRTHVKEIKPDIVSDLKNEIERKDGEIEDLQLRLSEVGAAHAKNVSVVQASHDNEIEALNAEIKELRTDLEKALQQSQTNAQVVEQMATLKGAMEPFVKCAKGEGTTVPEDWERLKGF